MNLKAEARLIDCQPWVAQTLLIVQVCKNISDNEIQNIKSFSFVNYLLNSQNEVIIFTLMMGLGSALRLL